VIRHAYAKAQKMKKEYLLITGSTGFIGSHVAERLLSEKRYGIIAIVRKTINYKNVNDLKNKGAILFGGSFYDRDLLEGIFEEFPIRNVIHSAALRGGGSGTKKDYNRINVLGTEALLEASFENQVRTFILFSSVGVFGTIPREVPAKILTELKGDNEYHKSKILAEKKTREFIGKGLNVLIIRPTITYGRGDDGFSKTLVELVKKRILLIPFKDVKIHLLNVAGCAELVSRMLKARDLNERVFIAADDAPILLGELVNLIHFHCHGVNYPRFLRMPTFVFRAMSMVLQQMGREKWATRILLISNNWHYDISETVDAFHYGPSKTRDSFLQWIHT